jgi:hypothetical protein
MRSVEARVTFPFNDIQIWLEAHRYKRSLVRRSDGDQFQILSSNGQAEAEGRIFAGSFLSNGNIVDIYYLDETSRLHVRILAGADPKKPIDEQTPRELLEHKRGFVEALVKDSNSLHYLVALKELPPQKT